MEYTYISNTDLNVSRIALGAADFGSGLDERATFNLLDEFVNLGGNFVDTALIYADWASPIKSVSEKTIGKWLKANNMFDKMIVGTKGAHPSDEAPNRLSRTDIMGDLEQSRENLYTETIPLYWLHRDDRSRSVEDIINTLNEAVRDKKIKYFGCSNWYADRIQEANDYAKKNNLQGFSASQIWWSAARVNKNKMGDTTLVCMDDKEYEWYEKSRMSVVAFNSQASGYYSKIASGIDVSGMGCFSDMNNEQRYERIVELCEKKGISVSAAVVAYLTCNNVHCVPIAGCKNIDQLRDSCKASEAILTPEDIEFIEA